MIAHAGYTVAAYRALDGGTARKEARGKMEKERLIKAADINELFMKYLQPEDNPNDYTTKSTKIKYILSLDYRPEEE